MKDAPTLGKPDIYVFLMHGRRARCESALSAEISPKQPQFWISFSLILILFPSLARPVRGRLTRRETQVKRPPLGNALKDQAVFFKCNELRPTRNLGLDNLGHHIDMRVIRV